MGRIEVTSENFGELLLESLEQALEITKNMNNEGAEMSEENKLKLPESGTHVIKFGAEWCPPCKALKPILERLSKDYDGLVEFQDYDVDEEDVKEFFAQFNVRSIPLVLFVRDGEVKDQLVGGNPEEEYKSRIDLLVE